MRFLGLLCVLLGPIVQSSAQTPDVSGAHPVPSPAPDTTARLAPEAGAAYRSPVVAGALSYLVFPGAGHVYAGEYETAGLLVGTVVGGFYVAEHYGISDTGCSFVCPVNGAFWVGLGVAFGALVYADVDAPRAARRANRRHERPAPRAVLAPALVGPPGQPHLGLSLHLTR